MKKTIITAFVLISILFIQGCVQDNYGPQKNEMQQQTNHTSIDEYPVEELSEAEIEALGITLNDEYKARAIYKKVIEKFGDIRPFSMIINSETQHADQLITLHEKYSLDVPEDNWYDKVPEFDSVEEACIAAVNAEIENAALYDEMFAQVDNQDIISVFTSLRDASKNNHLPAFQRCSGRP